jgi:hypothetical protein
MYVFQRARLPLLLLVATWYREAPDNCLYPVIYSFNKIRNTSYYIILSFILTRSFPDDVTIMTSSVISSRRIRSKAAPSASVSFLTIKI